MQSAQLCLCHSCLWMKCYNGFDLMLALYNRKSKPLVPATCSEFSWDACVKGNGNTEWMPALVTPNCWGVMWLPCCVELWKNHSISIVLSSLKQTKSRIVLWVYLGCEENARAQRVFCHETFSWHSSDHLSQHRALKPCIPTGNVLLTQRERGQAGSFASSRIWSWLQRPTAAFHCIFWQALRIGV